MGETICKPTELGLLVQMRSYFDLDSNSLSSAIPTQLGNLVQMSSHFTLHSNLLSSTIPTQLGQLNLMTYYFSLRANMLSSTIPTQLGLLEQMSSYFDLSTNHLFSHIDGRTQPRRYALNHRNLEPKRMAPPSILVDLEATDRTVDGLAATQFQERDENPVAYDETQSDTDQHESEDRRCLGVPNEGEHRSGDQRDQLDADDACNCFFTTHFDTVVHND